MNFKAANICRAICKTSFGLAAIVFFFVCAHIHSGFIHIGETCTLKSKRPKIFTRSFAQSVAQATWNVNNMHRLRTRAKATRRNKIKHKTFYFEIRTRDSLCVGKSGEGWMSQRRFDFFSGFVDVGVFTHKTREAHFRNPYASSPNFRLDLLHPIQCE